MTICKVCNNLVHSVIYFYNPESHKQQKSNTPVYFCGASCMIKWNNEQQKENNNVN